MEPLFLHRETLVAEDLVPELPETLKDIVKIVNCIKEMSKIHAASNFLSGNGQCACTSALHAHQTEVCWLPVAKYHLMYTNLKVNSQLFLKKKSHLVEYFDNDT